MIDFDRLEKVAELRRQGALTDDEFAREKARLLGREPEVPVERCDSRTPMILTIAGLVAAAIALVGWFALRSPTVEPPQAAPSATASPQPRPTSTPATPTPAPSSTPTVTMGEPQEGNCHMGECSWSRELKRETVGAGVSGRLIRLKLLGGTSDDHGSSIIWQRKPHDVYVFCSLALPSTMLAVASGWQVDVLDFVSGVPGVLISSAMLYGQTCHHGDDQFPNDAEALGYRPIPEERQSVTISKPSDIFSRADS